MAASGIAEAGGWVPAFPGQREPFREGNTAALRSGVYSPRILDPRTEAIADAILAGPLTPPWVQHPLMAGLFRQYCEAKAREELILADLDARGQPFFSNDRWQRCINRQDTLARKLGLTAPEWISAPPDALWRQAADESGAGEWLNQQFATLRAVIPDDWRNLSRQLGEHPQQPGSNPAE